MSAREELIEMANRLEAMLPRFERSSSGLHMNRDDGRVFKRLVLEAKVIFDDEFGRANNFSSNIVSTANTGVSNFMGSPSYNSVELDSIELARPNLTAPLRPAHASANARASSSASAPIPQHRHHCRA
jgi:hypothetical protein